MATAPMINPLQAELVFDEETHAYSWLGTPLTSISDLLKWIPGLVPDFSRFCPVGRRIIGEHSHLAIRFMFEGDLDMESLSPDVAPRVQAAKDFCKDYEFNPDYWEQPLCSHKWRIAGTPDAWDNDLLVNWKCSSKQTAKTYPAHDIQAAFYRLLIQETLDFRAKRCMVVQLLPDGTYHIPVPSMPEAEADDLALAALKLWTRFGK